MEGGEPGNLEPRTSMLLFFIGTPPIKFPDIQRETGFLRSYGLPNFTDEGQTLEPLHVGCDRIILWFDVQCIVLIVLLGATHTYR
jgi:hypothetical protein